MPLSSKTVFSSQVYEIKFCIVVCPMHPSCLAHLIVLALVTLLIRPIQFIQYSVFWAVRCNAVQNVCAIKYLTINVPGLVIWRQFFGLKRESACRYVIL